MKIRLIGRPGQIIQRNATVITVMESRVPPPLPNDLPEPPDMAVSYTVFMGDKQWQKVASTLEDNPDEMLVVDGYCYYDYDLKGLGVLASNLATKLPPQPKRPRPKPTPWTSTYRNY